MPGIGDFERMYRVGETRRDKTEAKKGLSEYLDSLIDQAVAEADAAKDPETSEKHRRRFDMLHELKEATPEKRAELLKEVRKEKIFTAEELLAMAEAEGPEAPEPEVEKKEEKAPKTPEELKAEREKEDRRRMAYRLITGDLKAEPPEDFTFSPKMEKITEKWRKARETVLKAHEDKARIEKQVRALEQELKVLRKGKDISSIGAKENELQWAQNKLLALQNLDAVEGVFVKSQEELKRQLINEFLLMKRKQIKEYLKVHKESYLKTLEQKFRERHGKAKDYELTKADKERMVEELLQDEALDRGAKTIGDTIVALDQGFAREKIDRTMEFKDKGRAEKLLERWNKMSLGKKIALSAAVSAGVASGAMFYMGGFSVAALGAVTLGSVAYRGLRVAVGFAAAAATKIGGNFLVNKIFGGKREKAREERVEMTMLNMKAAVTDGEIWIKNEQKKLEFAKIIDAMADEHRKKIEALAKKEKWSKRGVMALAILAAGAAAYWGTDYLFGGPPKGGMTMADLLERGKRTTGSPYPFEMDDGIAPPPQGLAVAPEGADIYPETEQPLAGPGPGAKGTVESAGVEAVPGKAAAPIGKRGIWGTVENILAERAKSDPALAEVLNNPAKKTYLTDMIKDKVVANPNEYISLPPGAKSIANVDMIPSGAKLDISDIIGDRRGFNNMVNEATGLQQAQMDSIMRNNAKIQEWVTQNPGKPLTGAQVEEILRAKPSIGTGGETVLETPPGRPNIVYKPELPSGEEASAESTQARVGGDQPNTATTEPAATAPRTTPAPEGTEQGGGMVITPEPGSEPVTERGSTAPAETPFGSTIEQTIAETKAGFRPEEYKVLKEITVDKLLKEIPETADGQVEMWRNFSRNRPPNLPHPGTYWETILRKQTSLADAIYKLHPDAATRSLTIEQFINQFGDKLDIKRSPLLWR